jgi:pyridoxamine 5'-phosphate oxidase family protein
MRDTAADSMGEITGGEMAVFTDAELEYLATQRLGRLATAGPGGTLQNNPVGFSVNAAAGTIDIGGWNMAASRKFRNVRANGRVAFVVDDLVSVQPWTVRGLEIRGHAEALTDAEPPQPFMSGEIIRIHPELIFSWGIEPGQDGMRRRAVG